MNDFEMLKALLNGCSYYVTYDIVYYGEATVLSIIGEEAVTEFAFHPTTGKLQTVNTHATKGE